MTRPVLWSRDALNELKRITAHIAMDNPEAARRIAAAVRQVGNKLGLHSTGRQGRVPGTREKSIQNLPFVIAYAIEPVREQESIIILHVIHTARDWKAGTWPQD